MSQLPQSIPEYEEVENCMQQKYVNDFTASSSHVLDEIITEQQHYQPETTQRYEPTITLQPETTQRCEPTSILQPETTQRYEPTITLLPEMTQLYEPTIKLKTERTQRYEPAITYQPETTQRYDPTISFQPHTSRPNTAQTNGQNSTSEAVKKIPLTPAERCKAYRKRKKLTMQGNFTAQETQQYEPTITLKTETIQQDEPAIIFQPEMTQRYDHTITFQPDTSRPDTAQTSEHNSTSETMEKIPLTPAERCKAYRKRKKFAKQERSRLYREKKKKKKLQGNIAAQQNMQDYNAVTMKKRPMTAAERQRAYRKRKKSGVHGNIDSDQPCTSRENDHDINDAARSVSNHRVGVVDPLIKAEPLDDAPIQNNTEKPPQDVGKREPGQEYEVALMSIKLEPIHHDVILSRVKQEPAEYYDVPVLVGEPPEVPDAGSIDTARVVKEEMDIGPTVLSSDMHYNFFRLSETAHSVEPPSTNVADTEQSESLNLRTKWIQEPSGESPSRGIGISSYGDIAKYKQTGYRVVLSYCTICNMSFTTDDSITQHMLTHTAINPGPETSSLTELLHCDICNKVFGDSHKQQHVKCFKVKKSFDCTVCGRNLKSKRTLNKHLTVHTSGRRKYPCDICSKIFTTERNFKRHKVAHVKKNLRHICAVCSENFSCKEKLRLHMISHNGNVPFKCNICNIMFARKINLKRHMKTHSEVNQYTCDVCSKKFTNRGSITIHMALHFPKIHTCNICGCSLRYKGSLKRHLLSHNKNKHCGVCNKAFSRDDKLAQHMLIHTGSKPYECDICKKSFRKKSYLKLHKLVHTGQKPHSCNECGKSFVQQCSLRRHKKNTHAESNPKYTCHTCARSYDDKDSLKEHVLSHTGKLPYCCDHCCKCFQNKSRLIKHIFTQHLRIKVPTKDVPQFHDCEVCEKRFDTRQRLAEHMPTHSKEKPHTCSICSNQFKRKGSLRAHMRLHITDNASARQRCCLVCGRVCASEATLRSHSYIHSGIKPFSCDLCGNTFRQQSHLNMHKMGHAGLRPFSCEVCNKSFAAKCHLKEHMWVHTGLKPFTCDICGLRCTRKIVLDKHKYSKHRAK